MEADGGGDGDAIATLVQKTFDELPAKRKPRIRGDDIKEWVPLSGIVVKGNFGLRCVALATGMKCLPHSSISQANGCVLHDWHAETLAMRSFNRFLLEECHAVVLATHSEYIRKRSEEEISESLFQPFALRDGIDIHMYCSEAPCGDASMELTMAAQDDASPWTASSPSLEQSLSTQAPVLQGRGYFSELGVVRRKPSRPDAPQTFSKSCSDKLSQKQCLSLLSSITSLLILPSQVYINTLVIPTTQYSAKACTRAFTETGRMAALKGITWPGGYAFKPFAIKTTNQEFLFSRCQTQTETQNHNPSASQNSPISLPAKLLPSNISASWTPHHEETIIGGILQGRKQFDPKGASKVCKKGLWRLALDIVGVLGVVALERALVRESYWDVKKGEMLETRREVKAGVRGVLMGEREWVRNGGGEGFGVVD